MKTNKLTFVTLAVLTASVALLSICTGGTSETGNARLSSVSGSIVKSTQGGTPASGVNIKIVAHDYIPGSDSSGNVFTTSTDKNGNYRIDNVPHGSYFVNGISGTTRFLSGPYIIDTPEKDLATDTLKPAARISVAVHDTQTISFVYIAGTTELFPVGYENIIIESAPAGNISVIAGKFEHLISTEPKTVFTRSKTVSITTLENATASISFGTKPVLILSQELDLADTVYLDGSSYTAFLDVRDFLVGTFRFDLLTAPTGMTIDPDSGIIFWLPDTTLNPTIYRVSVKVSNADSLSDSISWDLTVQNRPVVKPVLHIYGWDTAYTNYMYFYTSDSVSSPSLRYRFHYGDNTTSDLLPYPSDGHKWASPGSYTVYIEAVPVEGIGDTIISDTLSVVVLLHTPPSDMGNLWISSSPDSIIRPTTVKLYQPVWLHFDSVQCGINLLEPAVMVNWGNNQSNGDDPFKHHYTTAGTYFITGFSICPGPRGTIMFGNIDLVHVIDEIIVDTTPPIITLVSVDTTTNYMVGDSFAEPGYSAWDDIEKDITDEVKVISTGTSENVFLDSGWVTFTYMVADMLGNATEETRRVYVNPRD